MPEIDVRGNPDESRYEVRVDGELGGFAEYRTRDGVVSFTHTEVFDRFGGRGVGSALVGQALEDVRSRGLLVRPYCSFVQYWIDRHPGFESLVEAGFRES